MTVRPPSWLKAIGSRRGVAAALVTALTFVIIGAVLLVGTPLGCGPAKAIGIRTIGACGRAVAGRTSGTPEPSPQITLSPGASPSQPAQSPSPPPSPSPLPTPAGIPSTGPASAAYPPFYPAATGSNGAAIPGIGIVCRLPVYAGQSGSGGFIVFPGGQFIADPSSAVSYPSPAPGEPSPLPASNGEGGGQQISYDGPYSRWLPVGFSYVTPDGSRYAVPATSGVYVVDVATGTLSLVGPGRSWSVVGVQAAGVYAEESGKSGLWLLPFAGDPHQITNAGFWSAVSAHAGYGTPTSAVPQGATNNIIRVDLGSGQLTSWFTRSGSQSAVIGVDLGGNAIISVSYYAQGSGNEIWIVTGVNEGVPITGSGAGFYGIGPPVADSHGVWFAASYSNSAQYPYNSTNYQGFALYAPGHGLYWMSFLSAQLAGGCVQP